MSLHAFFSFSRFLSFSNRSFGHIVDIWKAARISSSISFAEHVVSIRITKKKKKIPNRERPDTNVGYFSFTDAHVDAEAGLNCDWIDYTRSARIQYRLYWALLPKALSIAILLFSQFIFQTGSITICADAETGSIDRSICSELLLLN